MPPQSPQENQSQKNEVPNFESVHSSQPIAPSVGHAIQSAEPSSPAISNDRFDSTDSVTPMPVVKVLSPRGVEYVMLTIALFMTAIGLSGALLCLVYGQINLMSLSVPVALLLVGLPIFAALFLRLKKAELENPRLKLDQSKRRSTQTTQILSFLISVITLVGLIVSIFTAISGDADSIVKTILGALVIFVIFTGILAYYWWDEHRM